MLFAALVLEREPPKWSDLPEGALLWLLNVGLLATIVLVVAVPILLWFRTQKAPGSGGQPEQPSILPLLFGGCVVVAALGQITALIGWLLGSDGSALLFGGRVIGGLGAVSALLLPFLMHLIRLRWRRIWALALVSFKEAVRRRVLWIFGILLLLMLFAGWFLPAKAEDQVRGYVGFISMAMALLLLIPAAILGSFGIPNDLANQTIYTIVTKPVERFEIYLGRVLGYTMLLSLVLLLMTAASLLYVVRGVSPEASYESLRARVPLYGELVVEPRTENLSVGREWDYRKYIAGGSTRHRAIWTYARLPADMAQRTGRVHCEYGFDIFRTTKGEERFGVFCTFEFHSARMDLNAPAAYEKERAKLLEERGSDPETQKVIADELAEKHGYYVLPHKEIVDYHTDTIEVPIGVFKHALAGDPPPDRENPGKPGPRLRVIVRCESPTQYVGMAKPDLYLLDDERSPYLNFFKGAAGLWLLLCLVVGVAVACSTQLRGEISLLLTGFLIVAGMFPDYVVQLATGTVEGGGPAQAALRLVKGVPSPVIPLDESPGKSLAEGADVVYSGLFKIVRMIVPDVNTYDLSDYVAKGFDVAWFNFSGDDLLVKAILLLGYLLPWGVAAYYLLYWREVAA